MVSDEQLDSVDECACVRRRHRHVRHDHVTLVLRKINPIDIYKDKLTRHFKDLILLVGVTTLTLLRRIPLNLSFHCRKHKQFTNNVSID